MSDKIKQIESRRTKIGSNEEWENFTTLIDDTRWLFQPDSATLRRQVAKGTKLNQRRVSSTGILLANDYASGVLSETITSGEQWFEYTDRKKEKADVDMLEDISRITLDRLNHSNFSSEMHRDQKSSAVDGTACFTAERINGKLNYTHIPFGSFWFTQDFRGRPDTVWVEKTTNAGALAGEYGYDNLSVKTRADYDQNPDKEVKIIYYCAPRAKRNPKKKDRANKPYELIVYEKDSNHPLDENGGVDMQKFMVYRVKREGNNNLGTSPAIDAVCSMGSVERASKDLQRGMRLSSVPVYGVAASMGQNGFRMIHQDDASILVYDDTGIASPPQTMNPNVNLEFALAYIEREEMSMRRLFYLDYFNPVMDKKNITATQTREIVSKSQQMVDQIVGPFIEERLNPVLRWTMILLGEAGEFHEHGSWDEIQAKMQGRVQIRYKSRLANAQKRIRLLSIVEYSEMKGMIVQTIPDPVMQYEFMCQTDFKKLPKELIEGTNAPQYLLRDEEEAAAMAAEFAEGMAQNQQMDNAVKAADVAAKTSKEVHPNSALSAVAGG